MDFSPPTSVICSIYLGKVVQTLEFSAKMEDIMLKVGNASIFSYLREMHTVEYVIDIFRPRCGHICRLLNGYFTEA